MNHLSIDIDRGAQTVFAIVAGILLVASLVGLVLHLSTSDVDKRRTVDNLNARTRAWWMMAGVFAVSLLLGGVGVVLLFALISFAALREVLTLSPTRRGDHRALFWAFFAVVPLQYMLILVNWYGMFVLLIPVYGFLILSIRSAVTGDITRYLERAAKIQWALMICVFCVSHAPALLLLNIPGFEQQSWKLIVFLVFVVQMSDVLQYVWGKLTGKHKIAPHLSPNKTVEGFVGGVLTATLLGGLLWWLTPFNPFAAMGFALIIALMGFFGGLVMSAIKRDAGVKDYGHLIAGHGGMMDRVDSLAFAAPIFFHLVRYFYNVQP
jgi:phosphatidate cytidylyltransferase